MNATITLDQPVEWFGEQHASVILREPRARHLFKHGEPRFIVMQGDGAQYFVTRDDAVSAYIDDLLSFDGEKPIDAGATVFLGKCTLADGVAIRDALFDFFTDAAQATFRKKQIHSSST
jgi:hypothetical protein